jgi:hypothetical protein
LNLADACSWPWIYSSLDSSSRNYRFLKLIAEWDRQKGWSGEGATASCAHPLTNHSPHTTAPPARAPPLHRYYIQRTTPD